MSPARLGDGTEVSPAEIAEARMGDGTVLFQADAIPDSAIAHYDATQESFGDGESVTVIHDFSGQDNDLTGGAPVYQTGVQNNNAAFLFDGVDDLLNRADPTVGRDMAVIAAIQSNDSGNENTIFSSDDDGSSRAIVSYRWDNNDYLHFNPDEGGLPVDSPTTDWQIITLRFRSEGTILRKNGTDLGSLDGGTSSWGGFRVGGHYGDSRYLDGYLGELLVTDSDLGGNDLDEQEQRMADKWGIQLA